MDATEFGVAAQDDIQCVRQLGLAAVLDVSEDATFGGVVDELVVFDGHVGALSAPWSLRDCADASSNPTALTRGARGARRCRRDGVGFSRA